MTLIDRIYGVFFQPVSTLKEISNEKPVLQGLLIFLIVVIFNTIINEGINTYIGESVLYEIPFLTNFLWIIGIFGALIALLMLIVFAGIFSLLGDVLYHKENARGILSSLCFSYVPGVLGPPLQYAAILAGFSWLGGILAFGISIWVIYLQIVAIREALSLKTLEAVFIFFLPIIVFVFILTILVTALIITMPIPGFNFP